MNYLSSQGANPTGFVGSVVTKIWSNYFRDLSEWTLASVDLDEQHTILDVGFGGGANIKYIKEHNNESIVYGIDVSEEAVKTATDLNRKYVDSGEVILTINDVAYMQFEDELFDLVVATQTHIYWEELEKGLSECYRVLKHNGTLLITSEIDKIEYHLPEYKNPNDFVSLLGATGFTDVNVKTSNNYVAFICKK
ncbi:class I SAM-dependent methyltransferase [Paenibacillus albiflavus]|uniref:Class I SAM-dependent methyltransferase n=2 Tax=Paenibacillus albiflavus TaxID=2545760 RepID=A0A4R4ED26_9BACL|nr:class I SAM-dependent methyltransferase [Paenibacillus albiflavus]